MKILKTIRRVQSFVFPAKNMSQSFARVLTQHLLHLLKHTPPPLRIAQPHYFGKRRVTSYVGIPACIQTYFLPSNSKHFTVLLNNISLHYRITFCTTEPQREDQENWNVLTKQPENPIKFYFLISYKILALQKKENIRIQKAEGHDAKKRRSIGIPILLITDFFKIQQMLKRDPSYLAYLLNFG